MPATMPARSWLPARDGPTSSEVVSSANAIGSDPYLRLVARFLAEVSVKLPLIWASPLGMTPVKPGLESTRPSSTTAKLWSVETMARERSAKTLRPSPPIERFTCQATLWVGTPAEASVRSVPSIAAGERRYFVAALSPVPQVTRYLFGSSTTGFLGGQL